MEAGRWWWSGRGDVTVERGGVGGGCTPVFEVAVEGGGSGGWRWQWRGEVAVEEGGVGGGG